jgi:hypothetical protein
LHLSAEKSIRRFTTEQRGPITHSLRFNTDAVAFFFGLETIVVSVASAVPEPGTTAVVHVEEPFDRVIATGTALFRLKTTLLKIRWDIFATFEVVTACFGGTIRTTTVFAGVATASREIGTLGWGTVVGAATEFGVSATTA